MNTPLESPYDIISKQTITSFTYRVTDVILFVSATVLIYIVGGPFVEGRFSDSLNDLITKSNKVTL